MDTDDESAGMLQRRLRIVAATVVALTVLVASATALGALVTGWNRSDPPAAVVTGASADGFSVWERNDDGNPVRWDPCSPVELVLSTAELPETAEQDLADAVDTLRDATGLELVVTGTTDERPSGNRLPYQPEEYGERWAPVLVAWSTPRADGLPLRDGDRGVAIPLAIGPAGDRIYISGQVVLNAERQDLRPGRQDRVDSWGATVLHELIHVLGLDHVDDPGELMHVRPGEGPVELGPGDRAGLRAVGADGGCLEVPTPRPVEVADLPER